MYALLVVTYENETCVLNTTTAETFVVASHAQYPLR